MALMILKDDTSPYTFFEKLISSPIYSVEIIHGGVMNYVFKVTSLKGVFYVKQALEKAKNGESLGNELATFPSNRIIYEANSIMELKSIFMSMPSPILPQIYTIEKENNILITYDLNPHGLLQRDLEMGIVDLLMAKQLGVFLRSLHSKSRMYVSPLRRDIKEDENTWSMFLDMRTISFIPNLLLKKEIVVLLHLLNNSGKKENKENIFIHMDFCPKNILYTNKKIPIIVDYEFSSSIGDPLYDLGFLCGHYLIHSLLQVYRRKEFLEAAETLIKVYCEDMNRESKDNILSRTLQYAASTLLYRIAGASRIRNLTVQDEHRVCFYACELLKTPNIIQMKSIKPPMV